MEGNVDHIRVGWKQARVAYLVQSLFGKLQRRFNSSGRGYARRKVDKKSMRIDDEDPWNFKRGIMYSSKCRPKKEC